MKPPYPFPYPLHLLLPPPKSSKIGIRVTDELYKRLARIEKATGIKPASLGNACLEAIATYFEVSKEISLPIRIISNSQFAILNTPITDPERRIGFHAGSVGYYY